MKEYIVPLLIGMFVIVGLGLLSGTFFETDGFGRMMDTIREFRG